MTDRPSGSDGDAHPAPQVHARGRDFARLLGTRGTGGEASARRAFEEYWFGAEAWAASRC